MVGGLYGKRHCGVAVGFFLLALIYINTISFSTALENKDSFRGGRWLVFSFPSAEIRLHGTTTTLQIIN